MRFSQGHEPEPVSVVGAPVTAANYATAHDVVRALMANQHTVAQDKIPGNGHLDSAEVVSIAEGGRWPGDVLLPGVSLAWHQGDRPFGLLISVQLLVEHGGGDVESMAFCLRLAVDEPHPAQQDGARLWFLDLPSGPY